MIIIQVDDSRHEYSIVKDYEQWLMEAPNQENEHEFKELLMSNLSFQKGNHGCQNSNSQIDETVTEQLPKQQSRLPEIPSGTRAEVVPITNDNYVDKKTVVREVERSPINTYLFQLLKAGRDIFHPYEMTQKTAYAMADLLAKEMLPVELGAEAMKMAKAVAISENIQGNEGLALNKLQRWLQSGVKDVEGAVEFENRVYGAGKQTAATRNGGTSRGANHQRNDGNEDWEQIEARFFAQKGT